MSTDKILTAIGLMSGTSMDGVDAAIIRTNGHSVAETGHTCFTPYDETTRTRLRAILNRTQDTDGQAAAAAEHITRIHADAVSTLLDQAGLGAAEIDVIGFHGQTIAHDPENGFTWQIGDGARLAALTGIDVVDDFRSADVAAGGQGAPLAPLYHRALLADQPLPVAVLNLGGVGNITYIAGDSDMLAFDTGPANALLDDFVLSRTGKPYDENGALAQSGTVDQAALAALTAHPYFTRKPPKSLDRNDFDPAPVAGLSDADGAATLTAFTIESVAAALNFTAAAPKSWLVTGGGRHNTAIMAGLAQRLGVPVRPVEDVAWNGDALEAQAFGFLAVRSLCGLPLSLPGTTGVPAPLTGGHLHRAGPDAREKIA